MVSMRATKDLIRLVGDRVILVIMTSVSNETHYVAESQRSHSHPSHLPQDIVYAVVGYLHDDKPTLASISLVSTACVAPTQACLFHTFCVNASQTSCLMVRKFLQSAPHICDHILELVIFSTFWEPVALDLHLDVLPITRLLPRLQNLELDSCMLQSSAQSAPAGSLIHLALLRLRNIITTGNVFAQLLSNFRVQAMLCIFQPNDAIFAIKIRVCFNEPMLPIQVALPNCISLRGDGYTHLWDNYQVFDSSGLTCLSIEYTDTREPVIHAFLSRYGASLRYLYVNASSIESHIDGMIYVLCTLR